MTLKSLNKYISFFILFISFLPINAEEKIDIWSKDKKENTETNKLKDNKINSAVGSEIINTSKIDKDIQIEGKILDNSQEIKIFGIYDPEENNFDLNMWTQTEAEKVRSSFNRINKIQLSNTATKLFENTILSFAYPPKSMDEKEFVTLKNDWMIEN